MFHPRKELWLMGLLLLAAPMAAAAQKLQPGTWTGTIAPPGNSPSPATFEVKVNGDSTSILLKTQFGELPLTQIKVSADRINFVFSPGPQVNCILMLREDKSYAGDCKDGNGGTGQIVMTPPKAGVPDLPPRP